MQNAITEGLKVDPTGVILGALMAGAMAIARDVAGEVVVEAYERLKENIDRRFGDKPRVALAIEAVEQRPASQGRQVLLAEELEQAKAEQDEDLALRAREFLDLLKEQGLISGTYYEAAVSGSGAVAQGPGAVAAGEGGLAIGGDAEDEDLLDLYPDLPEV
jgi:hypothetical protein